MAGYFDLSGVGNFSMNPNDHNKPPQVPKPSNTIATHNQQLFDDVTNPNYVGYTQNYDYQLANKNKNAANDLINKYSQSRNQISTQANEDIETLKHENNGEVFNSSTGLWDAPVVQPQEHSMYWWLKKAQETNPGEELPQGQDMGGVANSPGGRFFRNIFGSYMRKNKNGGEINKYQKGGNMNNQEELQKAFMTFLIEDARAQGMQIQSEQDLQAYAEQLGKEGIQAKYQEFMAKMQGGQVAKLGAKLNYIKKLKGDCPEGEEVVYFKKGGRVCKACQGKKAEKGAKVKTGPIAEWKAMRKNNK